MPHQNRAALQSAAESLCNAFASKAPHDEILNHFSRSRSRDVVAHEHGVKQLAPYLGRDFYGPEGVKEYFQIISEHLNYENMRFSEYVVDALENKVCARGEAQFTWTSTGQSWDEIFTYVLVMDEDDKVLKYEVWADTGAAYLASKGLLKPQNSI